MTKLVLPRDVVKAAADVASLSEHELKFSLRRDRTMVRRAAMFVCRRDLGSPLSVIGEALGGIAPQSALAGLKTAERDVRRRHLPFLRVVAAIRMRCGLCSPGS